MHCPGCWSRSGANGTGQHSPDLRAQEQKCEDEFCTRERAWYGAEPKQGKWSFRTGIIQAWEIKTYVMYQRFLRGITFPHRVSENLGWAIWKVPRQTRQPNTEIQSLSGGQCGDRVRTAAGRGNRCWMRLAVEMRNWLHTGED